EWLRRAYGVEGRDLGEAIRSNPAYRGIQAPQEVQARYLYEDVPTGLVPLADLGGLAGLEVPVMRSLITLASQVHGVDYWRTGRTLERLGLGDLDREGFLDYLALGRWVA
ncbi:MAG: NAD/NADP octopine/nopaline dehydrogenase family protein, partial [Bacillota bacterium]|nr:NAD/NADP octopine/nopaline dehydrogenase family protein [Bacillota bacterium]